MPYYTSAKRPYNAPVSLYLAADTLGITEAEVLLLTRTEAPHGRMRLTAVSPRPGDPYKPRIQWLSLQREVKRRDLFQTYGEHPACGYLQAAHVLGVTVPTIQAMCSPGGTAHDVRRLQRAQDGSDPPIGIDVESLRYEWERRRHEYRRGQRGYPPPWPRGGAFAVWAF